MNIMRTEVINNDDFRINILGINYLIFKQIFPVATSLPYHLLYLAGLIIFFILFMKHFIHFQISNFDLYF